MKLYLNKKSISKSNPFRLAALSCALLIPLHANAFDTNVESNDALIAGAIRTEVEHDGQGDIVVQNGAINVSAVGDTEGQSTIEDNRLVVLGVLQTEVKTGAGSSGHVTSQTGGINISQTD